MEILNEFIALAQNNPKCTWEKPFTKTLRNGIVQEKQFVKLYSDGMELSVSLILNSQVALDTSGYDRLEKDERAWQDSTTIIKKGLMVEAVSWSRVGRLNYKTDPDSITQSLQQGINILSK